MSYEYDPDALGRAEADIRARLADQSVDLEVQNAISNLYRAATVVSRSAEREVLAKNGLSWSAFTVLWVLWVWGEMDASRLAGELGLTLGTVTGVRKRLESQGLVVTERDPDDGRRQVTVLTDEGERKIRELYPTFNQWSVGFMSGISTDGITELIKLLDAIVVQRSAGGSEQ